MTGLIVTVVRESPHQPFSWSSRTSRWPSSSRPVGPNTVVPPSAHGEVGVEVGVEDHLPRDRKAVAVTTTRPGTALGEQVERGLRPGQVAERGGPPGVEGQLGAEGLLGRGTVGEGPVEVEGVGQVQVGFEVEGAGVVDVVPVDRDVARVDVLPPVLRIRRRIRNR